MANFGSLWVGGQLTKVQEVSLASFIYYGHSLTLFVYDDAIIVPHGVAKADARVILPETSLFLVEGSYSAFSDVFRYNMIDKTSLAWVDADTICLSNDWNFSDEIFAGKEYSVDGSDELVVGGVLSLKPDSEILNYMISRSTNTDKTTMQWADIGPKLVTEAFNKFSYLHYAYPPNVFCGIKFTDWYDLWDPSKLRDILNLYNTSKSISVYNQMLTRNGIDKNSLPEGSAMEYFYNKFTGKVANGFTKVFDKEDWIYRWEDMALVYPEDIGDPRTFSSQHLDLFTHAYRPTLGDTIFDIGSGAGVELPYFSKMVGDTGKVYALEADPSIHKKAVKLVTLLGLKNVVCLNIAVSDSEESLFLSQESNEGLSNTIFGDGSKDVIKVSAKKLSDIVKEYDIEKIDYLKMNIEGAEIKALPGAQDCIDKIKHWCVSTHDFCGIPSKTFVLDFFNKNRINVTIHPNVDERPWEGGYIYA